MRNLHPTHAEAYGFAEHIHIAPLLYQLLNISNEQETTGKTFKEITHKKRTKGVQPHVLPIEAGATYPGEAERAIKPLILTSGTTPGQGAQLSSVSVVIPLYGGEDDINRCLCSLESCNDLILETIVVDNGSPDNAADVAESFTGAKVIRLGENKGFAAACNRGIAESKGEVVLLLNSDTSVPRAGLIELLRSLNSSGSVAAAGPFTNEAGHGQQTSVTYTSLATMDLFAEDFAATDAEDRDVDMLVGFCLAIRRKVLDEIGPLDEEFGFGTFEDNDISYRMRRAGYRLVLSGKAFVHHEGSKTLRRMGIDFLDLMDRNRKYFVEKWKLDLEFRFVNSLPGFGPILEFHPERSPERKLREIQKQAKQADISLCMIVRDEEHNMAACLDSIKPFVREMIVVDTGSKDRTAEIAREKGAQVFSFPWTNSFSEARNESIKHAKGRWIFWMDADDVIDFQSGESLINNALSAPPKIVGFVVPVRFTDDGPAGGVQVDHVKLFRNLPGVKFEFHIHEQILNTLRKPGKEIARSAAFVLHKGYDTSPEGQQKKRLRDKTLLDLDLKDTPDHPFVNFNCGMTAHYTGAHEEAVGFLQKSIELADPNESHVRKAYSLLAVSLDKLGRTDEALAILEEGLEALNNDPEVHFHLGQMLSRLEKFEEAHEHYTAVLGADISSIFSSVDRGIFGFKTLHNRADVDMVLGRYNEAKEGWLKAIEAAPDFTPSVFSLFDASLRSQDFTTAREMMDKISQREGFNNSWCQMVEKYAESLGDPNVAIIQLQTASQRDPRAMEPRLALARKLLLDNRQSEAVPILQELQQRGHPEGAFHLGVISEMAGNYKAAFYWMGRAQQLNPGHEDTKKHLAMLKECMEEANA
ncbi:MAG TPA: glycosyltransferase [Fimbriimonadaceae bacterium]|jgi:GT2 family glycosyltransferase/tetratricopeptide (TPR) repeat protein